MADHRSGREFDLISKYFRPLSAGAEGALGLLDDGAVLDVPHGFQLVVTTDTVVAGVHFLDTLSPQDIAHKTVGVNLSDLAAMGAQPQAVFLAAQFPPDLTDDWIAGFASGLKSALDPSGALLCGGDTVSTPGPMAFTLTALGHVRSGQALKRSGAQIGDLLFTTGTIGDGALGLKALQGRINDLNDEHRTYLIHRYARPEPRWAFAAEVAKQGFVTAAVDVSDGLVADVVHICDASSVRAVIEAEQIPVSPAARAALQSDNTFLTDILSGGDDYELVFTAPENALGDIEDLSEAYNHSITVIGRIEAEDINQNSVQVLDAHGHDIPLNIHGYQHF